MVRSQWKHVTSSGGWNICGFFLGGILIVREGVPTGSEAWKKEVVGKKEQRALGGGCGMAQNSRARRNAKSVCVCVCVRQ